MRTKPNRRAGFTLVELVVVVLVMGIVAAVAAPRMFDTSSDARESATRSSLGQIRNALELYKSEYGQPISATPATLILQVEQVLQGSFPAPEVGNTVATVRVETDGGTLTASGTEGWAYDTVLHKLIVNHSSYETW